MAMKDWLGRKEQVSNEQEKERQERERKEVARRLRMLQVEVDVMRREQRRA